MKQLLYSASRPRVLASLGVVAAGALVACAASATTHSSTSSSELVSIAARLAEASVAREDSRAVPRASEDGSVVSRLIELGRRDNRVQDHLLELSLSIGPRLTASHNLERALQWTKEQFAAYGLEVRLESWGEFPVGFDRGPWWGGMVAPEKKDFEFNTSAWSAGTSVPRRGRAVAYPASEEALATVQDGLAGAWIVMPQWAQGERPKREVTNAIDAGLKEAGIAGKVRRAPGKGELLHTGGNYRIAWDKLPTDVTVTVRGEHFDDLATRLKAGEAVELEFSVDNRFFQGPVKQYNVIADLVGSEKPDEVVIVGGHLDSWDGAQGTVDNGTGCATTLEAARLLTAVGARPKRTIRFALWTGEEQGLFGSEGYVRDHQGELDKISAVLIHDGGTNYLSGLTCTPEMEADLKLACAPIVGLDPELPFELAVSEGLRNSGDSDHAPFIQAGVPGFFWEQAGRSDYDHMHHTQYDTFETAIPEYQRHSAIVAATVAYGIADLDHLLDRRNMEPIPPRRMSVQLDELVLTDVNSGGKAAQAGWQAGDKILAVDGVEVTTRGQLTSELQKGGPRKVVRILRGTETLETVLDYSGSKEELRREERRKARETRAADQAKRFW